MIKEGIKIKIRELGSKSPLFYNLEQILRLFYVRYQMFSGGRYLLINLDTNNKCNLACKYCNWNIWRFEHKEDPIFLSLKDFKKIADQLFPLTQRLFLSCNAEPLLTKNIIDYVKVAKKYGVPSVGLVTNGTLFNKELIEECILEKVDIIQFSIDAVKPDTYKEIRGGSIDRIINILNEFKNIKLITHSNTPAIQINYTIFDRNANELPLFIEKHSHLFQQINVGNLIRKNDAVPYQRLSQDEYDLIINSARKECNKHGVLLFAAYQKKIFENKPLVCFKPYVCRNINSKGELRVCSDEVIGNILDDNYKDIIDRKKELLLKLSFLNSPACVNCW